MELKRIVIQLLFVFTIVWTHISHSAISQHDLPDLVCSNSTYHSSHVETESWQVGMIIMRAGTEVQTLGELRLRDTAN